ncbi:hypothetical protein [Gimesia panareensis]|uniref:hypothetical protein n=1 Tax=Gimesia panareensis TaxID=2527978 RepID=UPI0018D625E2|nr:hypothetical protein [Gimesia panareensis]
MVKRLTSYSTLKHVADRSHVLEIIDKMSADIIQQFAPDAEEATLDSTGMETSSMSAHYRTRSGKSRKKYMKFSLCVLVGSMFPAGLVISWAPYNDKREARPLLAKAKMVTQPQRLFAEKGYPQCCPLK